MALPMTNILPLVSQFMADNCGISSPDTPLFVALSGGPDSVALLHILHTLGHPLIALHCNFHLRGDESDRDQHFCEALCQQLGITLKVKEFDTYAYMEQRNLSLEMAARELRYAWFELVRSEELGVRSNPPSDPSAGVAEYSSLLTPHSSLSIALGHHQDDSIETLLMNLMRGTGINGLTGIVARNEASHVVRPLLCLSRQQILDYLADNHLSYITDSSNLENDTLRNQIRNQLLPLMEQFLPQARHGISLTMQHLSEVSTWMEHEILQYRMEHARQVNIDQGSYEMIAKPDAHLIHPLTQYYKQQGFEVKVTRDLLLATPRRQEAPTRPARWQVEEIPVTEATPGLDPHVAYFDAAVAAAPLSFRRWQQADRIAPLGMHGHTRLLSDVFTDHHLPPHHKQRLWVVTDATGQILWVPGLIQSDYAKITSGTKTVLKVLC